MSIFQMHYVCVQICDLGPWAFSCKVQNHGPAYRCMYILAHNVYRRMYSLAHNVYTRTHSLEHNVCTCMYSLAHNVYRCTCTYSQPHNVYRCTYSATYQTKLFPSHVFSYRTKPHMSWSVILDLTAPDSQAQSQMCTHMLLMYKTNMHA